jgi:hypothetical protein
MTKVFIGGSRKIGRLSKDVLRRIDSIIDKRLPILIGDANGADKAVQKYLDRVGYSLVEVFCAGGECRNNLGDWPVRTIAATMEERGFGFYATKDRAMADEASVGLMIWDGKSVGTLLNMHRLLQQHKKVVVYLAPTKSFVDLRHEDSLDVLVSEHAPILRSRLDRESAAEKQVGSMPRQVTLL